MLFKSMDKPTNQILLPTYMSGEHTYKNVIAVIGHAKGEMWFYEENNYFNLVFTEDTVFITETHDNKITEISQLEIVDNILQDLLEAGIINSYHIPALYSNSLNAKFVITKLHTQND